MRIYVSVLGRSEKALCLLLAGGFTLLSYVVIRRDNPSVGVPKAYHVDSRCGASSEFVSMVQILAKNAERV